MHRYNTIGEGVESPATTGGDASSLRDFELLSLGGTVGHGLWCRARAFVENVRITSFPQNGLYVYATAGSGGNSEGNANNCHFSNMRISNCVGNGVHVQGADANACMFDHIDSSTNRGMGFNDESFLGNTYVMPHTNGNGVGGQVSWGGNRYYTINPVAASTTEPGTDSSVWIFDSVGGVHVIYPLWVSGNTYILGHPFRTTE